MFKLSGTTALKIATVALATTLATGCGDENIAPTNSAAGAAYEPSASGATPSGTPEEMVVAPTHGMPMDPEVMEPAPDGDEGADNTPEEVTDPPTDPPADNTEDDQDSTTDDDQNTSPAGDEGSTPDDADPEPETEHHGDDDDDRSFQAFLDALRDYESGISTAKCQEYADGYDVPDAASYARLMVDGDGNYMPGRLLRDRATGGYTREANSYREFFEKLGVDHLFDVNDPCNADTLRAMQYSSLNAWGFVGYQLGESVLIEAGYYAPRRAAVNGQDYEVYYQWPDSDRVWSCEGEADCNCFDEDDQVDPNGSHCIPGERLIPFTLGDGTVRDRLVSDTCAWEGTFTGKNGVNSYADLKTQRAQETIIRDVMRNNIATIRRVVESNGMSWNEVFEQTYQYDGHEVRITMSGLLAAAHLRGAFGTANLLLTGRASADELGTNILHYVHAYGGYDTLFDSPADDTISGSPYSETLTAGSGNDQVILGGGIDTLFVAEYARGGTTTVSGFQLGEDRIILRDHSTLENIVVEDNERGVALVFGNQHVLLVDVSLEALLATERSAVIRYSRIYDIAWRGTATAVDFDPASDIIRGSSGIAFNHLVKFSSGRNTIVGSQAEDGGVYAYVALCGVSPAAVNRGMFDGVFGSFEEMTQLNAVPQNFQDPCAN